MAAAQPDVIVFELGDGLLGTYGVESILRAAGHQGGADRRGAVRQRSGRRLGRRQVAARALRHRALRGHRPRDRQSGRRRDHPRADGRRGIQRHQQSRGARRSHHRARWAAQRAAKPKWSANERRARPAIVLGGTGYVAGELLRLIAGHPRLALAAILSDSQPGASGRRRVPASAQRLSRAQIRRARGDRVAASASTPRCAPVLGGAPRRRRRAHRPAAAARPRRRGTRRALRRHLGGLSATRAPPPTRRCTSMRTARRRGFANSPARCRSICRRRPTPHVAHPGCFATATLLASVPLLALGLTEPRLFVDRHHRQHGLGPQAGRGHASSACGTAISTPTARLSHRHVPEIVACAKLRRGIEAEINFVPHSGPFARGIHVTVQASLKKPLDSAAGARGAARRTTATVRSCGSATAAPRVKDVATSNYAHSERGDQRHIHRGHVGGRQSQQGRRRRRHAMDESAAGIRRRPPGLTAPAPGVDLRHCMAATTLLADGTRRATWRRCSRNIPSKWRTATACGCTRATAARSCDFYGGHAVAGLGYGHPRWLAALERQARQMTFQTNALPMAIRERAAARLAKFAGSGSTPCSGSTAAPKRTRTR